MSWSPSKAGFSQERKIRHPPSFLRLLLLALFWDKQNFGVHLKIVLQPFVLFTKHKSMLNMQWRKSTKMLSEIHLWACRCPKGTSLTRGTRCWNETTEFIKMSGISSVYSPHSVTYFSFVLFKNEVVCLLSGKKKKGFESKTNKKIRVEMQTHLTTWICFMRGSQVQIQDERGTQGRKRHRLSSRA